MGGNQLQASDAHQPGAGQTSANLSLLELLTKKGRVAAVTCGVARPPRRSGDTGTGWILIDCNPPCFDAMEGEFHEKLNCQTQLASKNMRLFVDSINARIASNYLPFPGIWEPPRNWSSFWTLGTPHFPTSLMPWEGVGVLTPPLLPCQHWEVVSWKVSRGWT